MVRGLKQRGHSIASRSCSVAVRFFFPFVSPEVRCLFCDVLLSPSSENPTIIREARLVIKIQYECMMNPESKADLTDADKT